MRPKISEKSTVFQTTHSPGTKCAKLIKLFKKLVLIKGVRRTNYKYLLIIYFELILLNRQICCKLVIEHEGDIENLDMLNEVRPNSKQFKTQDSLFKFWDFFFKQGDFNISKVF